MDNGAIGFFLFFVILIIIWIFAMGGCVRERKSLGVFEGLETYRQCLNNCAHGTRIDPYPSYQNCRKCKINCCKHYNNGQDCSERAIINTELKHDITQC